MENTFVGNDLNPGELNEGTRVALNKIRAFVRSLGEVERCEKEALFASNDYSQDESDHVSLDTTGT